MVLNRFKQIKNTISEKREEQSKHIVALDIGTEYVKALVAKLQGDEIEIIGVGRQHQGSA